MTVRPLILAMLVGFASTGGAQIIRSPGAAAPAGDTLGLSPVETGRRAQSEFERYRRLHLPSSHGGRPGSCDEVVGRFCYWYAETVPPKEPADIGVQRNRLSALLDSLARVAPDDRWITGQRVRYLAESERLSGALMAAHECKVGGWWCQILAGFSLHLLGTRPKTSV
jgi:hypothetical protein